MPGPDPLPGAPVSPVAPDGSIAFGTYQGTTGPVDWFAQSNRPGSRRCWKRWHYLSVAGPEVVLAAAVVHLGWAASAFAYLFDRTSGRLLADESVVQPLGRAATVSAGPSGPASSGWTSKRLHIHLARGHGRWTLRIRSLALTIDATLTESPGVPTLCAIAPVPGGVADCTHKTPALAVDGLAHAGGRSFDLSDTWAALDHTSGLLARTTRWRWASATSDRLSLNLTEDFTGPFENAMWHDGTLTSLGPVHFAFDPARPASPWHISDDRGQVDLIFAAEGQRSASTNLLVASSSYVQPIGTFAGRVGSVEVADLPGVTEDHTARW